jgi:hypothetical protein
VIGRQYGIARLRPQTGEPGGRGYEN